MQQPTLLQPEDGAEAAGTPDGEHRQLWKATAMAGSNASNTRLDSPAREEDALHSGKGYQPLSKAVVAAEQTSQSACV